MLEIYIATLKARIAGGPCQHGEGRRGERGFRFSVPALRLRKWQPQPAPPSGTLPSSVFLVLGGCSPGLDHDAAVVCLLNLLLIMAPSTQGNSFITYFIPSSSNFSLSHKSQPAAQKQNIQLLLFILMHIIHSLTT